MSCEAWKPLLAGYVDGELTVEEERRLKEHLSRCTECREELMQMRELSGVTETMKREPLPDVFWDRYWLGIYNRLERGVGWIALSLGGAILAGYGLWHFVREVLLSAETPLVLRVGIGLTAAGIAVLTVSLVRERVRSWRHDPYKEVQR